MFGLLACPPRIPFPPPTPFERVAELVLAGADAGLQSVAAFTFLAAVVTLAVGAAGRLTQPERAFCAGFPLSVAGLGLLALRVPGALPEALRPARTQDLVKAGCLSVAVLGVVVLARPWFFDEPEAPGVRVRARKRAAR